MWPTLHQNQISMLRHRIYLKTFLVISFCWLIVSVLLSKFKSSSDGYNEIGFPLVFYRSFSGKCFDCKETGFLLKGFFLDIAIVVSTTLLLQILIRKTKSVKWTVFWFYSAAIFFWKKSLNFFLVRKKSIILNHLSFVPN